jgi:hypothetical protein
VLAPGPEFEPRRLLMSLFAFGGVMRRHHALYVWGDALFWGGLGLDLRAARRPVEHRPWAATTTTDRRKNTRGIDHAGT